MKTRPISAPALKRLQVLYAAVDRRHAMVARTPDEKRADRLTWAALALGRGVESFSALSSDEGKFLIDNLQTTLGVPETAPSIRQRKSRHRAEKEGTEGRRDQIHPETTMLDGSEQVFKLIQQELTLLGWDETRLRRFLASRMGPNSGRETIRTLAEANRVHWALKKMSRRAARTPLSGVAA